MLSKETLELIAQYRALHAKLNEAISKDTNGKFSICNSDGVLTMYANRESIFDSSTKSTFDDLVALTGEHSWRVMHEYDTRDLRCEASVEGTTISILVAPGSGAWQRYTSGTFSIASNQEVPVNDE